MTNRDAQSLLFVVWPLLAFVFDFLERIRVLVGGTTGLARI